MIESISLRHFKGHTALDVEFPPGLTLVSGSNYTGKTTLLHAILFALWGVSAVPGGAKRITTRGHSAASTEVALRFYHAGDTYTVTRKIANASLRRGDTAIATGLAATTKELEQIIGMPSRFFLHLKYAEQGGTQALLTLGAAELHKVLDHVSGASVVNTVITRAAAIASDATSALAALGDPPNVAAIKQEAETLSQRVREAKAKSETLRQQAEQALQEVSAAAADLDAIRSTNRAHETHTLQLESAQVQLKDAVQREDGHKRDLEAATKRAENAQARINHYEGLKSLAGAIHTAREQVQQLNSRHSTASTAAKQLQQDLQQAQTTLSELGTVDETALVKAESTATARYGSLQNELRRLEQAASDAVCPACNRPFEGADVAALTQQRAQVRQQYEQAKAEQEKASKAASAGHALAARISASKQAVERLRFQLGETVRQCDALWQELELAQDKLAGALTSGEVTQEQLAEARERAATAQQALGYLEAGRAALARTQAAVRDLRVRLEELQNAPPPGQWRDPAVQADTVAALRRQQEQSAQQAREAAHAEASLSAQLGYARQQVGIAEETAAKIARYAESRSTSGALAKYLRTNRDRFMSELWQRVTDYASAFAAGCTGGAIQSVGRTTEGAFTFVEDGFEDEVITASGAQRSIMSLGIQLALDTLLPDTLGALLLDEATANMDPEHATTLTQALASSGRQVIMVSHRELDASVAQAHIQLG